MAILSRTTRSSSDTMSPSETSPLLSHPELPTRPKSHWKRWKVAYLYGLIAFTVNFGSSLRFAPEVRLMEVAVCRKYYFQHDPSSVDDYGNVPEALCKLDVVQGQLAMLSAWLRVFNGVIGILVAVPFGFLADTKGRRLVTALSLFGGSLSHIWVIIVCYFYGTFQPEAIWWSSLFELVGGGDTVLNAVFMAALSDFAPADKRTALFFYTYTACLIADLIATPMGPFLMTKTTLNTAMICSIALEYLALLILLFAPETLRSMGRNGGEQLTEDTAIPPYTQAQEPAGRADDEADFTEPKQPTLLQFMRDQVHHVGDLLTRPFKLMSKDRAILLGLPAFLTSRLLRQVVSLLLQYASKKLGLTIAAVGFLVSVRPAVSIVLFALILPNLSRLLASRLDIPTPQADLLVAKISGVLLVIGLLIIGLGQSLSCILTGLIIFTLGWGFDQSVQLWLTSRVEQTQIGLLYSATSVVGTLGGLVEAPLLAVTFSTGLGLGGAGTGLPFFVAGGICVVASVGVWLARLR